MFPLVTFKILRFGDLVLSSVCEGLWGGMEWGGVSICVSLFPWATCCAGSFQPPEHPDAGQCAWTLLEEGCWSSVPPQPAVEREG